MELAIATAEGAADLEAKLDHLHDVCHQPYQQLQRFSAFAAWVVLAQSLLVAHAVAGLAEGAKMPLGSLLDSGMVLLGTFFVFLFLFWVGTWIMTSCGQIALACRAFMERLTPSARAS